MKVAITIWNNRVAPVFDSAGQCLIITIIANERTTQEMVVLLDESNLKKIQILQEKAVDMVICGGLSIESEWALTAAGIQYVSFVAGNVQDVITAYMNNMLFSHVFSMPGCRCPRRNCQNRRRSGRNSPQNSGGV